MDGAFVVTSEVTSPDGRHGAHIDAFVAVSSERDARDLAIREITQAGWHCTKITRVAWTTARDYVNAPAERGYFEQSLTYRIILVIQTIPHQTEH